MEIPIKKIRVGKRLRQDLGDIQQLMQSISQNGLIQPVVVNKKFELLAGYRRLLAARKLGWKFIEVKVIDARTRVNKLDVEMTENLSRKDFNLKEIRKGEKLRLELLKLERMHPVIRFFYQIFKGILNFFKKLFNIEEV